ncbi:unnamed protein product [Rotaria sp. Silwood1]|nr:unnamed protein product [Rotaria sp. Silwood1]CAF4862774.1 unnamed protein product [Rotaria sp. Silwood1]
MNFFTTIASCLVMLTITYSIHSHPLHISSNHHNLASTQIDMLCSYISHLQKYSTDSKTIKPETQSKRFVMPFPDMNRFLSTSHKLHHHDSNSKTGTKSHNKKHDFHAYLCSISKDSEEMSNFLSIFIEEHGQPPAFNIFESCEQVAKRDQLNWNNNNKDNELPSVVRFNELSEFCSNRSQTQFVKRWRHTVEGPISIDFIHQMLESRKVKSYPYPPEMDPYIIFDQSSSSKLSTLNMAGASERTFIMVKPDGVQRGLVGDIIRRFEQRGYKLVALKMIQAPKALLESHYEEHKGKKFYEPLLTYIGSGPVVAMVWEGLNVISVGRKMLGATDPAKSEPGTIRGDYAIVTGRNIVHGSDSENAAKREIDLWFRKDEVSNWVHTAERWIYE